MHPSPVFWSVRKILALTGVSLALYLLWVGPERFYYESFGTWIVSPAIYPRLLPSPWNGWLIQTLLHVPGACLLLQAIPVLLLLGALAAGIFSIRRDSRPLACLCLGSTALVFGVYHWLQPFGITLVAG